ncbi:hypothetical protein VNO77_02352 [Canavalia gladiata]|uniref:Uncharacterized protein n=1 Tax=Canavalia gladiata TaxID=3824 RepID=A0AAN9R758_CANGL
MQLMAHTANPNLHHTITSQLQTSLWPASVCTYESSQIATRFKPSIGPVTTVLEPVPESNTHLFPHGARLKDSWTQKEHELFLMGLIKYGKGRWSKIAREFLWNKTPQQVQKYAASFFRHLPSTYLHGFRRRKGTYSAVNNLMGASSSYSMPKMVNEPQQTLMLFPEKAPSFPIPPYGEGSSSTNRIMYQIQLQTGGASTSMTASANGEVDLELRLGRCLWGMRCGDLNDGSMEIGFVDNDVKVVERWIRSGVMDLMILGHLEKNQHFLEVIFDARDERDS